MARAVGNETGWRGSADVWLAAAYDGLIESGVDAVRIMPLAKRINLSRTSFYWFFRDREALLEALLDLWREKNTGCIVKQAGAYAESVTEALLNVMDCWLDRELFDSKFEFAVRSWALQSPDVSAEILSADRIRLEALAEMFVRHGFARAAADVRARTVYLTQIGYISMKTDERLPERMSRIPYYIEIYGGQAPTRRELERFFARHGYSDGGSRAAAVETDG
ncbi:MAG TPA: TetR/AcrR family transcriptional regulator [Roseiarcus sp.]|jgi:AcrR family transcriptional regulator